MHALVFHVLIKVHHGLVGEFDCSIYTYSIDDVLTSCAGGEVVVICRGSLQGPGPDCHSRQRPEGVCGH